MKKIIAVLPVVCMVLLCGCNQKDARNLPPAGKETEKIVIWSYYETQAQREGLDELVRSFNQSQNEYRAEWEYVPMTGFVKGLSSAYTENDLPDMAIIDNPDMAALIQMGLLRILRCRRRSGSWRTSVIRPCWKR